MAAYGNSIAATAATATQLDTGNLNVTGTDLALLACAYEDGNSSPTLTFDWDPAGNNEGFTEQAAESQGTYVDTRSGFLDDPTAANAPVRVSSSASATDLSIMAAFCTAAGAIVATDYATDNGTDTTPSSTPSNVASGDLVLDFVYASGTYGGGRSFAPGADQTERIDQAFGNYCQGALSTQAGADGGVMSWTISGNITYGRIHHAYRVPDAGGAPSGAQPLVPPLSARSLQHLIRR